jgi:hypothetical protein
MNGSGFMRDQDSHTSGASSLSALIGPASTHRLHCSNRCIFMVWICVIVPFPEYALHDANKTCAGYAGCIPRFAFAEHLRWIFGQDWIGLCISLV